MGRPLKRLKTARVLALGALLLPGAAPAAPADLEFARRLEGAREEFSREFIRLTTHRTSEDDPRYLAQKARIEMIKQVLPSVVLLAVPNKDMMTDGTATKDCTGFFIKTAGILKNARDGVIATNAHCVEDLKPDDEVGVGLLVRSREFPKMAKGRILAFGDSRKEKDIAFVQLVSEDPGDRRPGLELSADKPELGEEIVSIGHPFDLQWTVTRGIVTALDRTKVRSSRFLDGIQTDAALNRGNSGGPMLDLWGSVVGINTMILEGNADGFAIPAKYLAEALRQFERTGNLRVGYLGIDVRPNAETGKPVVSILAAASPAETAGLRKNDELVKIDEEDLDGAASPEEAMAKFLGCARFKSPGETTVITVRRGGKVLPAMRIPLGTP